MKASDDVARWAETHGTDPEVAAAIHALATPQRTAEAIWEDPTTEEERAVSDHLRREIEAGRLDYEPDGYHWGQERIRPYPAKSRAYNDVQNLRARLYDLNDHRRAS